MHNWLGGIYETQRSPPIQLWHLSYNLSPGYQQGKWIPYSVIHTFICSEWMQQSVFPFCALPCQIRHKYPQVLNTMTAVGAFPKHRLCGCEAQRNHRRQKVRLGYHLPKADFRLTELTKSQSLIQLALFMAPLNLNGCLNSLVLPQGALSLPELPQHPAAGASIPLPNSRVTNASLERHLLIA